MSHPSRAQLASNPTSEVVRVENLHVHFSVSGGRMQRREQGIIRAVDGVRFTLRQGEIFALVGAPRCGKSTVARAVALLERPTEGRIAFRGRDVTSWRGRQFQLARRRIQMIFSNPYVAFAPRMTVREIITEAFELKKRWLGRDRDERVGDLMSLAHLNYYFSMRYPRDLSGGQRQRLALARALAAEPALLVCDQPVDYLDPAMAEVFIDQLYRVNRELGLTVLLTARRLAHARHADRIAVMVQGRIVEMGYRNDLIRQPLHPFSQNLIRTPSTDLPSLDPLRPASGCHYAPLCPLAQALCHARFPAFVEGAPDHGVACHLVEPSQPDR